MTTNTTERDELVELAVALYVADECNTLDEARLNVDRVRAFMLEGRTAKHCSDCTKQCHTCLRCLTDTYLRMAGIVAALTAQPTTERGDWLNDVIVRANVAADKGPAPMKDGRVRHSAATPTGSTPPFAQELKRRESKP